MKHTAVLILALMIASLGAAQQAETIESDLKPGMVGPGSPFYGLETALDNAAVSIGLKKASKVAQERAAEVRKASQNNNTKGMEKAAKQYSKVASKAKSDETQQLMKAQSVLQQVMENAPEEAQKGLMTALNATKNRGEEPPTPEQRDRSGREMNNPPTPGSQNGSDTQQQNPPAP